MFKKKNDKEVNVGKLNDLIGLSHNVLKILLVLLIIVGAYLGLRLLKEVQVLPFIFTILRLLAPLFIGLAIAWLLNPIVNFLQRKGLKRWMGAAICYIVLFGVIVLILSSLIPVLSEQINEFVSNTIPSVFNTAKTWIDSLFDKFNNIENFDALAMKAEVFTKLEKFATDLTSSLPGMLISVITALFSGVGLLGISLIIGFFLLLDFNKHKENLYLLIPKNHREEAREFLGAVNLPLRRFVNGTLIDCTFMFVIMTIGFSIIGLKAPLLFALFCAVTNIIPYAGPYIGGAPAVIVGLTQSTTIGVAVLIFIVIVQTIEGNFLQPFIMSKTTKLSPVAIILGLLVFGHFFGVFGMVLSTPILGAIKEVVLFFDNKYHFLNFITR